MESLRHTTGRVLTWILALDVALFAVAGLACLGGDQCTAFDFTRNLQIAGIVAAGIGALAVAGNFANVGDWKYQFGRSVSVAPLPERTQQEVREWDRRTSVVVLLAIAGVIALIAGTLLQSVVVR